MTQDSLPLTRQTQTEKIKEYLLAGNTLTQLQSLDRFKCLRLGARCWDLRQKGINVQSRIVETPSGKHIAEYFVPQNEPLIARNGKKEKKIPFETFIDRSPVETESRIEAEPFMGTFILCVDGRRVGHALQAEDVEKEKHFLASCLEDLERMFTGK